MPKLRFYDTLSFKHSILQYINGGRNRTMRSRPRFSQFIYLVGISILCAIPFRFYAQGLSQQEMEKDILYYVNQHREEIGKPPLKLAPIITAEAMDHSKDMAKHKISFGHDGFEDRVAIINRKLKPYHAVGENVAYGQLTAEKVVQLWLRSAGHRKNIEGDYNLTGIGISQSKDGTIYYTQMFILNDE